MLEEFIHLSELSAGERIAVFNQIWQLAMRRGLTEIVELADQALIHDRETVALDSRWEHRNTDQMFASDVSALGNLVDPVLTSIRDIAWSHVQATPPASALRQRVDGMLGDLFPPDQASVRSLPFVEQVTTTEFVLSRLQTVHASLIDELGLRARVMYLAELATAYRAAVDRGRSLAFSQVQTMREQGKKLLLELVALVLGTFRDMSDPAQVTTRADLLAPVFRAGEFCANESRSLQNAS